MMESYTRQYQCQEPVFHDNLNPVFLLNSRGGKASYRDDNLLRYSGPRGNWGATSIAPSRRS